MRNNHQRRKNRREKQNESNQEEKRVSSIFIRLGATPKIITRSEKKNSNNLISKENERLGATPKIITKSEKENSNNLISKENDGSCNGSIGDKVKLHKRGQSTSSSAELFQTISQLSLPGKTRKRKNSNSVGPSKLSPSSLSSENSKDMLLSSCNTSHVSSSTSKSKVINIPSYDQMQCLPRNCEPHSAFDDIFTSSKNHENYNLPFKKAKVLEQYSLVAKNDSLATLHFLDEHQFEVASYEEVSSVEPLHTSSVPILPECVGVYNVTNTTLPTNIVEGINSTGLTKNEIKSVSNRETVYCSHPDVCSNFLQESAEVSLLHHNYSEPIEATAKFSMKNIELHVGDICAGYTGSIAESLYEDLGSYSVKNLEYVDWKEYLFDISEAIHFNKSSFEAVDNLMHIGDEIKQQSKSKVNSSEVTGLTKKDICDPLLSKTEKYIQAKDAYVSRINSRDSVNIVAKQLSRHSASHTLNPKSHVKDYKCVPKSNGVFKHENQATKEKRKAMDERCIVYVGNIPYGYSVMKLRNRFEKFGTIKDIQIKSKVRNDFNSSDGHSLGLEGIKSYGFITFSCNQEASDAIERGNIGHSLRFHLSFGARRQFVGEEYKDLDGIVAKNENSMYKSYSRSSYLPQKKEEDYDIVLKNAMAARGVKPQPFRMKCKA